MVVVVKVAGHGALCRMLCAGSTSMTLWLAGRRYWFDPCNLVSSLFTGHRWHSAPVPSACGLFLSAILCCGLIQRGFVVVFRLGPALLFCAANLVFWAVVLDSVFLRLGGHQLSRVPPVVLKQHWHFALAGQFVDSSNLVSILFCTVPLPTLRVPCGCSGCCAVVVRCCVVCGCGVAQATHPQRMSSVPDCSFTNKQGADGDVCCVLVCCVLQQPLVVCCVTMQHNRVSVWPVRRSCAVQCSVHSCCVTMCQGKCWKCEQRIQLWLCWAGVPL